MTAINLFLRPKEIFLLTDGAVSDGRGNLVRFASKPIMLPHIGALMVCTGPESIGDIVQMQLASAFVSFDELVIAGAELLHRAALADSNAADPGYPRGGAFSLVVAGLSQSRGRTECWVLNGDVSDLSQPWRFQQFPSLIMPHSPEMIARLQEIGVPLRQPELLDPMVHGLQIIREQRYVKGGDGTHAVGAFAQMTHWDLERTEVRIIEVWPVDRLGEPLGRPLT